MTTDRLSEPPRCPHGYFSAFCTIEPCVPDPRPCLTCGKPHGIDGWNPRHIPRYFEPTRPVANLPADHFPPDHQEREFKFTTDRPMDMLEQDLLSDESISHAASMTHIYVSPVERFGRRVGTDGVVSYVRTVKDVPPASADIPPGVPLSRRETNHPLTTLRFGEVAQWALAGKYPFLNKRRYDVPLPDGSGLVCEIDLYTWPPDAPVVIEVEVPEGEARYITPTDLPEHIGGHIYEVTQDPTFYAAHLARRLPF